MGHFPPPSHRPAITSHEASAQPAAIVAGLRFEVDEGLNQNLFLQTTTNSCHGVVTTSTRPRLLLTFPAGNSGLGLWMDAQQAENSGLEMKADGALSEVNGAVQITIQTNHDRLAITRLRLDSIRTIRQDDGDVEKLREKLAPSLHAPAEWATPSTQIDGSVITFQRRELGPGTWVLRLRLPDQAHVRWDADRGIDPGGHLRHPLIIENPPGQPIRLTVEGQIPFQPLTPRTLEELVQPAVVAQLHAANPDARFERCIRDLHMMSYREKYLAGCWRFETYFGRDTLLSLAMLSGVLQPAAYVDGLDSVLTRLSPEGVVAHEEDIGAWAEVDDLRRIDFGGPHPAHWGAPQYDYKMVDSDTLLPLAEARLTAPQLKAFLHGPRLTSVLRNWNRVLAQASYDMVRINPGFTVGNWRDSDIGLGGGEYPGDINSTFVPDALRAIQWGLHVDPGLRPTMLRIANEQGFWALRQSLDDTADLQHRWQGIRKRFEVRFTEAEARSRVAAFLDNLPADQHRVLILAPMAPGVTMDAWLHGTSVPAMASGVRFWALSMAADQRPIEVLNSDPCFTLYFGDPPVDEVADIVRMTALPYPVGLMTDAGMVVANPAYAVQPNLWKALDRDAYHGAVVWGWQHNMMALGLMRQIHRLSADPHQASLVAAMERLLAQLKSAEDRCGSMANSELWTWDIQGDKLVPLAFGVRSSSDDESNAIQLWSAAYAGVVMGRSQLP